MKIGKGYQKVELEEPTPFQRKMVDDSASPMQKTSKKVYLFSEKEIRGHNFSCTCNLIFGGLIFTGGFVYGITSFTASPGNVPSIVYSLSTMIIGAIFLGQGIGAARILCCTDKIKLN